MPTAPANGIELCYDTFGSPSGPPLVLVMGLGAQMIAWPADFCQLLAAGGWHVIRFDNRDCGLSTHLDGVEVDIAAVISAGLGLGPMPAVPYVLSDFASDTIGLLDHLGIASAHIVGASMGGMIVQTIAIEHPQRVRSLTSIMSATGEREVMQPTPEAMAVMLRPPGTNARPGDRGERRDEQGDRRRTLLRRRRLRRVGRREL